MKAENVTCLSQSMRDRIPILALQDLAGDHDKHVCCSAHRCVLSCTLKGLEEVDSSGTMRALSTTIKQSTRPVYKNNHHACLMFAHMAQLLLHTKRLVVRVKSFADHHHLGSTKAAKRQQSLAVLRESLYHLLVALQ